MQPKCIIEPPSSPATVRQVRSTLLQSSLNSLKQNGHYERYLERLDPAHRDTILGSLAPEWLPLEVADAHYRACEDLGLSESQMRQIGETVGDRIQGTFLQTVIRRGRALGLNPWLPLGQFQRLWERLMVGGGVALYQLAPKDCRVDILELPLAKYDYFRVAFTGVVATGIRVGAGRSVSVKVASRFAHDQRLSMTAMWV